MAKLTIESLEHSRQAGMATISGKGYLALGNKLAAIDGIDSIEHDKENGEYVVTYNKEWFSTADFKALYKELKSSKAS